MRVESSKRERERESTEGKKKRERMRALEPSIKNKKELRESAGEKRENESLLLHLNEEEDKKERGER